MHREGECLSHHNAMYIVNGSQLFKVKQYSLQWIFMHGLHNGHAIPKGGFWLDKDSINPERWPWFDWACTVVTLSQ